jgi:hypothetical protein
MSDPISLEHYATVALYLALVFLILALLVAAAETALALWIRYQEAKAAKAAAEAGRAAAVGLAPGAVDPVKLLEALKALLEALKWLPAWIAIFLAGALLFWMGSEAATPQSSTPERPKQEQPSPRAGAGGGGSTNPAPATNTARGN